MSERPDSTPPKPDLSEKDIISGLVVRWSAVSGKQDREIDTLEQMLPLLCQAGFLALEAWDAEFDADKAGASPTPKVRVARRERAIIANSKKWLEAGGELFELYRELVSSGDGPLHRLTAQSRKTDQTLSRLLERAERETRRILHELEQQRPAIEKSLPEHDAQQLTQALRTHVDTLKNIQEVLSERPLKSGPESFTWKHVLEWFVRLLTAWGEETIKLLAAVFGAVLIMTMASLFKNPVGDMFSKVAGIISHEAQRYSEIGQAKPGAAEEPHTR